MPSYERFIASRLNRRSGAEGESMSRPAVRVAITGMALGLAVMLIAVAVVTGFKREVRAQVIGFGGHIQILPYSNPFGAEQHTEITADSGLIASLAALPHVRCVQPIASIPGVIKTESEFKGVVLKGVDCRYDWDFFAHNMKAGVALNDSASGGNAAVISSSIARAMKLDVGDDFIVYFMSGSLFPHCPPPSGRSIHSWATVSATGGGSSAWRAYRRLRRPCSTGWPCSTRTP